MPGTELITLCTADGVLLDGAAYFPAAHAPEHPPGTGLLLIHGKGGNFYTGPSRFLAKPLAAAGHLVLALNMRVHDIVYLTSPQRLPAGGAYEQFSAGWQDLDAGVAWLRGQGCQRVVVCGHSSGGLYAVDYAARGTGLAGLVLLSPLLGNRAALPMWFPEPAEMDAARNRAEAAAATGQADDLMPLPKWHWAISAASLLSRFQEAPDVWDRTFERLRLPILMLYGDHEERAPRWHAIIAEYPGPSTRQAIAGANHHYTGREDQVATAVQDFLHDLPG